MIKVSGKEIFSTGEIAALTGVTVRTLQYYDNIGLLPATTRNESGYRIYDKSDIAKLQQIIFYKSLGLKINDIQEIVKETTTDKDLISRFENQQEILYRRLNNLMGNLAYLETSLDLLKAENELPITNLVQLINSLNQETIFEYEKVEFDENSLGTFSKTAIHNLSGTIAPHSIEYIGTTSSLLVLVIWLFVVSLLAVTKFQRQDF